MSKDKKPSPKSPVGDTGDSAKLQQEQPASEMGLTSGKSQDEPSDPPSEDGATLDGISGDLGDMPGCAPALLNLVVDDDGRGKAGSYSVAIVAHGKLVGTLHVCEDDAKRCADAFKGAGIPVKLSWTHR